MLSKINTVVAMLIRLLRDFYLRWCVVGAIVSLGALFSSQHLVFDLISHFRVQYIVLLLMAICLALPKKRFVITAIFVVCLSIHGFEVYRSQAAADVLIEDQRAAVKVMSSNLLAHNSDYGTYIKQLNEVAPDVLVFQEYSLGWDNFLSKELVDYPYRVTVPLDHPFGIAVYSKLEIVEDRIVNLMSKGRPSIQVVVEKNGKQLNVFGTHPPPPVSNELYWERNQHLLRIAEITEVIDGPMIVVGDLNVTPWSHHFREFVKAGKLRDGRRGHGILPTWPAQSALLRIPIDYVVVNDSVNVTSMDTSGIIGSDHRAIWAEVEF